jgi:intermediate peptidase
VYAKIFAADPLSREAGEKYKNEVLKHGGGKDPWTCVGSLLQDEALLSGDQRAMDAVGSWNINE